jgi:hypothetical protein
MQTGVLVMAGGQVEGMPLEDGGVLEDTLYVYTGFVWWKFTTIT